MSIHQEATIDAAPEQVYAVLTDGETWAAAVYSIVRFTLQPEGTATKLVVDHDAIPEQWEEHIASGYPTFYLSPLARYFAA
jgi:activator of HSP90 ATPase